MAGRYEYINCAKIYEFYEEINFVPKTIFYKLVQRASEILFLPWEHNIYIFEPTCNVLFGPIQTPYFT